MAEFSLLYTWGDSPSLGSHSSESPLLTTGSNPVDTE